MFNEFKRLARILRNTEPGTETYDHILSEMSKLFCFIPANSEAALLYITEELPSNTADIKSVSFPEEVVEPTKTEEPPVEYTKEDVRELLTEASKRGVKIQPIIKQFVPEGEAVKFSSIPASAYGALVEAVNNA